MSKIKVLIPYASYGSGHKTTAQSIAKHLEQKDYDVLCVDVLKYINPVFEKITTNLFEKIAFKLPFLWEIIYKSTDFNSQSFFHKLYNNRRLQKLIFDFNPDIVISTHFFPSRIIADYITNGLLSTKIVTIVTDYETHAQWITNRRVEDAIVVNTPYEKKELQKKGLKSSKIKTFGIPISEKFYNNKLNHSQIKKKLNLKENIPIILFLSGGSSGSKNSLKYLKKLVQMHPYAYILFISGTNKKVYNKAIKYQKKYHNDFLKVYGFVNNMPEFLAISDFVITKPGGATVTECLHMNKPMLLITYNAGQERANYKYIVRNNFGKKVYSLFHFRLTIKHFLEHPEIIKRYAKNISHAHNDNALIEIEKLIQELLNKDNKA